MMVIFNYKTERKEIGHHELLQKHQTKPYVGLQV